MQGLGYGGESLSPVGNIGKPSIISALGPPKGILVARRSRNKAFQGLLLIRAVALSIYQLSSIELTSSFWILTGSILTVLDITGLKVYAVF